MKQSLTARQLRVVLLFCLVLLFGATTAGFLYVRNRLDIYATEISHLNADAKAGDQNLKTLQSLETELKKQKETIVKTKAIIGSSTNYTDVVIAQLSRIAKESGVTITGFDFADAVAAAPTAATPASPAAVPTAQPLIGVSTKSVMVSVESPLKYNSVMSFLQKIEANTLQMQVASVSLTKANGDLVSSENFTIQVYVK